MRVSAPSADDSTFYLLLVSNSLRTDYGSALLVLYSLRAASTVFTTSVYGCVAEVAQLLQTRQIKRWGGYYFFARALK